MTVLAPQYRPMAPRAEQPVKKTNELDLIWKALADETRRSILDYLRAGPKKTTEIVEQFSVLSRFGVMKHLQVLRDAGLVTTNRQSQTIYYALAPGPALQVMEVLYSAFCEPTSRKSVGKRMKCRVKNA